MVSHRLSSIQIKSYKTLYRRWFHIGCQVKKYIYRLYSEDGFNRLSSKQTVYKNRLSSIQIKSYKILYRRWFHIGG